jgi:glyoxylase-like metal-dependent hydrolase (beta-lactamase superfamily II)
MFVLLASGAILWSLPADDLSRPARSPVPSWDARGVAPLPRQGIACIDLGEDARWLAIGTIAPPGDPNVLLLNGDGDLVRTAQAGQRWIQQVAVDRSGALLHALCTMPEGRAGDFPTVSVCGKQATAIRPDLGESAWPQNLFHYGDHSNHTGVILRSSPSGGVAVYDNRVLWLQSAAGQPQAQVEFPRPPHAVTVSMVAGRSGQVLVGCATAAATDRAPTPNLFLLDAASRRPLWSRPASVETDHPPPPPKGLYGTPTLPDGRREELPQKDVEVWAPLSLAIHGDDKPRLLASADYRGWQRWVRSSATLHEQNYGTRFPPGRPVVSVYDGTSKLLRRFGPEQFLRPTWVDLQFHGGGKYLLAYPHHWTCRGLGGQTILPADDDARRLFVLEVSTGKVSSLEFPAQISDVSAGGGGLVAVGCWDGNLYLLDDESLATGRLPAEVEVGGPSLVRVARDGDKVVVATTAGVVRLLDRHGKEVWRRDLNHLVKPVLQPWVANARAERIGDGVWQLPGGRVESDLGGQRVVEAPDGLILIEGHAGLSFEREWAAMEAVGLDPRRVKYVLATHEHGDHAPGAYLWRLATGARFVCSAEMADTLQHHLPLGTGYGLHPPVPTDVRITADTELDLAGLKVRALRLPGHTFGSMGWLFTKGDRKYIAFGDLIMPDGPLGYAGSINFSARDILASLRKLQSQKPDFALPGHGPIGDPTRYIEAGIEVGVRVGWGKMPPEKPDPYFRLTQKNVRVAAWNIDAASADFGDLDGDGKPDIAIVAPDGEGAVVKLFLNRGGTFAAEPDHVIRLPGVASPTKIRLRHLGDRTPAILVGGQTAALLIPAGKLPKYRIIPISLGDAQQIRVGDVLGNGSPQTLIGSRFGGFHLLQIDKDDKAHLEPMRPEVSGPYIDCQFVDLNGDGRTDLITSYGKVYLRQADGKLPAEPTLQLALPEPGDWTSLAVGDFNGDSRPDVVLLSYGMRHQRLVCYSNTGNPAKPFAEKPDVSLDLGTQEGKPGQHPLLRDAPVVADWNRDGIADLVVGKGQDNQVLILFGGKGGLDLRQSTTIPLDYRLHYETGLHVADIDGDGIPDLACFGYTSTGVGAGGPNAVYLWRQPRKSPRDR